MQAATRVAHPRKNLKAKRQNTHQMGAPGSWAAGVAPAAAATGTGSSPSVTQNSSSTLRKVAPRMAASACRLPDEAGVRKNGLAPAAEASGSGGAQWGARKRRQQHT